jgi:hypothetical protein
VELIHLFNQGSRIHDNAVSDDTRRASVQDARGNEMKDVGSPFVDDGMPGIGPTLIPDDNIGIAGQDINDLALTLIAPLRPDDDEITHNVGMPQPVSTRKNGSDQTKRSEPRGPMVGVTSSFVKLFSHDVAMRMIRLPSLLANQTIQRFLDWSIPAC